MMQLYQGLLRRDNTRVRWSAIRRLERAERDLALDAMTGRRQRGREGIGVMPYQAPPVPGTQDARKAVSERIAEDDDATRRVHLMAFAMQGELMRWDSVMAQDMSWGRLIYGLSPALLKFALNSRVNMLPTNDNLARWRKGSRPCKLCGADRPTPAHVLSSCPVALKQQRYTYRHNQVLTVLYNVITSTVAKLNRRGKVEAPPSPSIRFVRAGETVPAARRKPPASTLESGLNWQLS